MQTHRLLAALISVLTAAATAARIAMCQGAARNQPRLLLPGGFQTETRPEIGPEPWFGLYHAPRGGYDLRRTVVAVDDTPYGCGGRGHKISATGPSEPLFLVAGLKGLQEGRIDSVFSGKRFVYPAEAISLRIADDNWYRLSAFGTAQPGAGEVFVTNYQLVLQIVGHRQVLATFPRVNWDLPPQLLWAGDLDRDRRIDLLMDLGGNQYALFVSALAEGNDLVTHAADFATSTC